MAGGAIGRRVVWVVAGENIFWGEYVQPGEQCEQVCFYKHGENVAATRCSADRLPGAYHSFRKPGRADDTEEEVYKATGCQCRVGCCMKQNHDLFFHFLFFYLRAIFVKIEILAFVI